MPAYAKAKAGVGAKRLATKLLAFSFAVATKLFILLTVVV